jgi:hypothetical protein
MIPLSFLKEHFPKPERVLGNAQKTRKTGKQGTGRQRNPAFISKPQILPGVSPGVPLLPLISNHQAGPA